MTEVAVDIINVGKEYHIGTLGSADFRESIGASLSKLNPFRNKATAAPKNEMTHTFWALKDVTFQVERGEAVGIIGRNGAGKSTLLKILSRITEPTTGRVVIDGRVSSLLEVGTGFHPELTGRENIFLNGTILGMRRKEVSAKLDQIIEFSGVEKFLDTPIKHYSSGMKVRLAFSVAAHLEPEILIIDEVLAVGDAEFQKKCLGKMEDVAHDGRTVLFVSHNMAAVQNFCRKVVCLQSGKVTFFGEASEGVEKYLMSFDPEENKLNERSDRIGDGTIRFRKIFIDGAEDADKSFVLSGQDVVFVLEFDNYLSDSGANFQLDLGIHSTKSEKISWLSTSVVKETVSRIQRSDSRIFIRIPKFPLMPGGYRLAVFSKVNGVISDWVTDAFSFEVREGNFYETGKVNPSNYGSVLMSHSFRMS